MDKIKMTTPIVEMDGDEMTRILWQMIKDDLLLPYIDLKTEYYDPVSYTHLDVYKRQIPWYPDGLPMKMCTPS